jgi:hypothetical protein
MHAQMRRCRTFGLCLAVSWVFAAPFARADEQKMSDSERLDRLEKENKELRRRLELLEGSSTQDVYVAKSSIPEETLKFLGQTQMSGFVSASYFYNFNSPPADMVTGNRQNTGRGFDTLHDEFMANKFVLILTKPVDYNAFDWQAGYYAELILGQDAAFTQAYGLSVGNQGDLEQAYVQFNVPVGNGLKVMFGKYATPMGYELTETEQNYNWSGGLQWTFVEPFTHTGVQLGYKINDQWEVNFLVNNGWDDVKDNNSSKSFMGRVGYTPNDNTSVSLIGYGGPEQLDNSAAAALTTTPGNHPNGDWRRGADVVVTHHFNKQFQATVQLDYGIEDGVDPSLNTAEWWATGLWLVYEPSEKWNIAGRADYLRDKDGARTFGAPASAPFFSDTTIFPFGAQVGQELVSLTLTVNIKPMPQLRIAPELRWDHSSVDTAFDGRDSQVTVGVGLAYFY